MIKKRVFALIAAAIITLSSLFACVVPSSAVDVSFTTSFYNTYDSSCGVVRDEGASTYPYKSLYEMLLDYYSMSGGRVYYFELQNTIQGGTPFSPSTYAWSLAYEFNQSDFGVGNPLYRFYVPADCNWRFQIRTTELSNLIFDSNSASLIVDPSDSTRAYYQFEVNRNILGVSSGWYIYSENLPGFYSYSSAPVYQIIFNYVYNGNVVDTQVRLRAKTYEDFTIEPPAIPNYIINAGYEDIYFSSLLSDVTYNIPVSSVQDVVNDRLSSYHEVVFWFYGDEIIEGVYERLEETVYVYIPNDLGSCTLNIPFPKGFTNRELDADGKPISTVTVTRNDSNAERYSLVTVNCQLLSVWAKNDEVSYMLAVANYKTSNEFKDAIAAAENKGYEKGMTDAGNEIFVNPINYFVRPAIDFLGIEVFPGVPLGIPFVAVMVVSLVVIFLKVFAR